MLIKSPSAVTIRLALFLRIVPALLLIQAQTWAREAAATLKVPQVPGSYGYAFNRVFPELVFPNAVGLATPPGETNRLFVLERLGRVAIVTNLAAPTRSVFLDLTRIVRLDNFNEMGLLGLTFHPNYAENGRFFVFYTATASNTRQNRLSEFRVSNSNPQAADPDSEKILIQQQDDAVNHNGGDLHFGPDGYLYVALGDEGGANDQHRNSQRLTKDFFAGILRLDVDQRPGSLPPNPHPASIGSYRIPSDNPFVGATNFLNRPVDPSRIRTEFWSVGLRNPWRISFDRATGELWVGDVGQDARESVAISRAGANHGWAFREANIAGPLTDAPLDFLTNPVHQYVPPLHSYLHRAGTAGGFSVTGGLVYRGARLSQLHGAYVFADYVSGNVWSLVRSSTGGPPTVTRLTGYANIAGFGVDPRNGDLLAVNHANGQLVRLDYTSQFSGEPIPEQLSGTGAFRDLATLNAQPGIVPYEVNLSFWSDGALKRRWFSIPNPELFAEYRPSGAWITPPGTVWIKHFEMELIQGSPSSRRRLETRFLVRNNSGVHGFTYRWNAAQTDAQLVPEAGEDELLQLKDAAGNSRSLQWRYPSRAECLTCHNAPAGGSLSFTTSQLYRSSGTSNPHGQIGDLAAAGYFPADRQPDLGQPIRVLVPPEEERASLSWRARSWLDVNCGYCHQPGGTGGALFDARLQTASAQAGLVRGNLNSALDTNRFVVTPGATALSELHARIAIRGPRQMPPLATSTIDPAGVALIERWIRETAVNDTYDSWQGRFFADPTSTEALPESDPDRDGRSNNEEFLFGSSPKVIDNSQLLSVEHSALGRVRLKIQWPANRAVALESTESLASPNWTPVTLGSPWVSFLPESAEVSLEQVAGSSSKYYRARILTP